MGRLRDGENRGAGAAVGCASRAPCGHEHRQHAQRGQSGPDRHEDGRFERPGVADYPNDFRRQRRAAIDHEMPAECEPGIEQRSSSSNPDAPVPRRFTPRGIGTLVRNQL